MPQPFGRHSDETVESAVMDAVADLQRKFSKTLNDMIYGGMTANKRYQREKIAL